MCVCVCVYVNVCVCVCVFVCLCVCVHASSVRATKKRSTSGQRVDWGHNDSLKISTFAQHLVTSENGCENLRHARCRYINGIMLFVMGHDGSYNEARWILITLALKSSSGAARVHRSRPEPNGP